ncbi:MAG: helix-turn-helix domain-containing protein [Candidatus Brockarchaeota archaeon]|nr:helix-turn-helix domain-containing protein [Candidatus Brockarchaeota archaeon]MBO3809297.1 helix-turn-helix domain-containing protein [Candidatus Brockarchaeota archaeon]MBO3842094.1 helix-turn-helix domain-containing protein [Candidatus Brockarchaeota archaeon]
MRKAVNIFEAKATRVLRALLTDLQRNWTIRGLAEETGISAGYAHAVISTLIDLGYVTRTEAYKIKVVNPTLLLRRWAAYHQYDRVNTFLEYYTFEQEVERFIYRLSTITNIPYALTGLAGASLVAPHVRPVDVHMYVHREDIGTLAEVLRLQPIPKGGNVKFVIPYDEGVYYGQQRVNIQVPNQAASEVPVVSNIQLFVDLYNYPARGLEAAEHLYKQMIGKWGKALVGE